MQHQVPLLSILIITYNRAEDTLLLLQDIEAQHEVAQYVGEILLLNNNSSDSYEKVTDFISQSRLPIAYIVNDKNPGVAGGRNQLIQSAKFPHLLVLDDDIVFADKSAIEKIARLFSKEQYVQHNTAIITLNIYYHATGERQKNALPHKEYAAYKDKDWFLTYYFTGAAHLMKRDLFDKTGYYPEDFFYGVEEYDLSFRALDAGYTIAYDADVKVLHKESPQGRLSHKTKLAMMWRNKCIVAYKYLPKKYFYSTLFMWSLFYLKRTGFDLAGAFRQLWLNARIPRSVKSSPVSHKTLRYLQSVKARLGY
ncbi:MAG: glycosyltransferase [Sphingobacteriales bacterium]|nr:MAG: glycosyltransferase [Sphingobacteriales bacterium]